MKRLVLVFALTLVLCLSLRAREKLQGYCELGGQTVATSGLTSTTKVQRSYPSCTVTVYDAGTTDLATIYSDSGGTPKANPFTADGYGYWSFYADNGRYDVQLSGGGIASPFTRADFLLSDISVGITSLNELTGTAQTLVVGSDGTDFVISSAGTTHTFNIPTVSAENRGLVTSALFNTWNAKENPLTFTAPLSRSTNTVSLTLPLLIGYGGSGQTSKTPAFNALAPGTTKGDVIVHDGTNHVRLGVGANNYALLADSAQSAGAKWGQVSLTAGVTGTLPYANGGTNATTAAAAFAGLAPTTTKGDLIGDDGSDPVRVPVGANGAALTADSTQSSGLAWKVPSFACRKDTVAYTNDVFKAASTTADVSLFTATQYQKLTGITIKHSAQFSDGGGAMTDVSVSVGKAGTVDFYTTTQSIGETTAVADTTFLDTALFKSGTMASAGQAVVAHFIATGRDFGDGVNTFLTGGSVDVWSCYVTVQ